MDWRNRWRGEVSESPVEMECVHRRSGIGEAEWTGTERVIGFLMGVNYYQNQPLHSLCKGSLVVCSVQLPSLFEQEFVMCEKRYDVNRI